MNKKITYNIVNSLLAGGLVMLGSCANGDITARGLFLALVAGLIVAVTKFKEYWTSISTNYQASLFNFI